MDLHPLASAEEQERLQRRYQQNDLELVELQREQRELLELLDQQLSRLQELLDQQPPQLQELLDQQLQQLREWHEQQKARLASGEAWLKNMREQFRLLWPPKSLAKHREELLANARRAQPNGEGTDFEDCWHMLEEALRDIHNKSCGRLSFEELYRAAYKIVIKKRGEELYARVKQFEEQWFAQHVIPKIEALVTKSLISIGMGKSSSSANERRQTGEKFLKGVRDTWEDHNMSMNMTADILMYLDRGYTQQEPNRVPIFATTIALFRDHILRSCLNENTSQLVVDIVISVMLDQIDMEREDDIIDRNLIRSCSRMLSCLYESEDENESKTLYLTVFQDRFLKSSDDFYAKECQRLLRDADASTWLRHTQQRLSEEADRCGTTIESETLPKILAVVERRLISDHLQDFLAMEGSGLRWMIDNDKIDDLSILYRLITRVDASKAALRTMLQKRVIDLGLEIESMLKSTDFSAAQGEGDEGHGGEGPGGEANDNDNNNNNNNNNNKAKAANPAAQQTAMAIKWVDDVLRLKEKFDKLLSQCFEDDLGMQTVLTKSFSEFINMFSRSSEYVSLFIDDSLKRGIRGKTEAEVDGTLEKAIILIRHLQDRDLFQTYYQRHLARRLLHGKSESHDVEKQMVSRMKQELGQQFTSKLEGMFRDLATSAELTSTYRAHMSSVGDGGKTMDLNISVLTSNYWPQEVMGRQASVGDGARVTCNYPHDVRRLQASFEQFYLTNRNGRKLTWVGSTGSADIRCTFPAIAGKSGVLARERRYEINVPTFAMVVLLLFNDVAEEGESLSFEEIQAKTGISTPDLMRTLTAIAVAPKSRVLLKDPATRSVKAGDRFSFNASFQSKAVRIKAPIINAVSRVEGTQERKTTEEKNNQTRAHVIDAAIVRIMKSRKELSHAQLVGEVLGQLSARFKPEVSLIKRRIEDLIVREYLERPDDEDGPSTYRYVA